MSEYSKNKYDILILLIAIIPLIFQIFNPTTDEGLIITGIMLVIGLLSVGWAYIANKIKQIESNTITINKLKDNINTMNKIHKLDKRLSLLEKKKGQINPQWVIIIILLILLYLFLRSAGYLN